MNDSKSSLEPPFLYDLRYPWLPTDGAMSSRCCLCRSDDDERTIAQFKLNDAVFILKRCDKDSLVFLDPQPSDAYLKKLYDHPSYVSGEDDLYGMKVDDEKTAAIAKLRIEEIGPYTTHTDSFLEIGCGDGHTMEAAHKAGFKVVRGLEFSHETAMRAQKKGLDVVHITSEADLAQPGKDRFDVIALYSVLEHLRDPLGCLQAVSRALAENGIVVIRVPNTKDEIPRLSILDHLWHFNEESLRRILALAKLTPLTLFPSGVFSGSIHGGELESMTCIAKIWQDGL
jgi:SAM-dependent methyltransferase